jgi:hypothetical protein
VQLNCIVTDSYCAAELYCNGQLYFFQVFYYNRSSSCLTLTAIHQTVNKLFKYRVILLVLDPRKCEYLAGHFRKHESSRSALPGQWWRTFLASPLVSHEARYVVIYACSKSNE